jgi:NAD(P)-dependent dehydrogenase (short-subunit alcohol dehydrogenase family)
MKIKNKVALVTGATGGIGLATARRFLQEGVCGLGLVDISPRCEDTVGELRKSESGDHIRAFVGDVSDAGFREHVFREMEQQFGPVQICVPAAGIVRDGLAVKVNRKTSKVELYPEQDFRQILDINLLHPAYWAMETIAGIARHRQSCGTVKWNGNEEIQAVVVLIGSVSCRGNRGQVGYAGAKAALNGICSTLNLEGLFYGVQTKIIHPGFVDTPMVETIDADYFEEHLKPQIGLGRKIRPQEIAEIICAMVENPVISGAVWADASMRPLA